MAGLSFLSDQPQPLKPDNDPFGYLNAKYQIIWLICLIGNKVIQMIKTNSLKPIHQP